MGEKTAKLASKIVLSVAKKSSNTVCDWFTFQPKVPTKLTKDK